MIVKLLSVSYKKYYGIATALRANDHSLLLLVNPANHAFMIVNRNQAFILALLSPYCDGRTSTSAIFNTIGASSGHRCRMYQPTMSMPFVIPPATHQHVIRGHEYRRYVPEDHIFPSRTYLASCHCTFGNSLSSMSCTPLVPVARFPSSTPA